MPGLKVSQLHEEIVMEILSRLPVKSLARFKCVSKPWRSLISSPAFAKFHLKRAQKQGNGNRVLGTIFPYIYIDIDAYDAGAEDNAVTTELSRSETFDLVLNIVGSCDGLVCLSFCSTIVVWNPRTREYRCLPQQDSLPEEEGNLFFGFGYDSHTDDYKVVRGVLLRGTSAGEAKVQIFSLKGDAWRSIENLQCGGAVDSAGVLSNGVLLHWLVKGLNVPGKIPSIVSFDLVEEKFLEVMRLPNSILDAGCTVALKAVGDQLHMYTDDYSSEFEVWVMKEYKGVESCWTRVVNFSNKELLGYKYWPKLVYVTRSGKVLLDFGRRHLILYNPNVDTFKPLPVEWDFSDTAMCVESLVSPNQTNPTLI